VGARALEVRVSKDREQLFEVRKADPAR
jgi:hypothetical protein